MFIFVWKRFPLFNQLFSSSCVRSPLCLYSVTALDQNIKEGVLPQYLHIPLESVHQCSVNARQFNKILLLLKNVKPEYTDVHIQSDVLELLPYLKYLM